MPFQNPKLDTLIAEWAPKLQCPPTLNPVLVLKALAWQESDYGQNTTPRTESAYLLGGKLCPPQQQLRLKRYGIPAARSYSSFQLMYPTACELGFVGAPTELEDDAKAIPYVVALLNRRVFGRDHAQTIEDVGDSYNSGSVHGFKPLTYIAELTNHYRYLGGTTA